MNILLDTNVLIAAFIARGVCHELFEHCAVRHTLVSSPALLLELREKLTGKFKYTEDAAEQVIQLLQQRMQVFDALPLNTVICRDPDDDVVLGTALAGQCVCIITGDKDLLTLQSFRQITIISPKEFASFEESQQP